MPKMKTKRAAAKRFRVLGSGKIKTNANATLAAINVNGRTPGMPDKMREAQAVAHVTERAVHPM